MKKSLYTNVHIVRKNSHPIPQGQDGYIKTNRTGKENGFADLNVTRRDTADL